MPLPPKSAAVSIGGIVAAVVLALFLVLFLFSFRASIRTLFSAEESKGEGGSNAETSDPTPTDRFLRILCGVVVIPAGVLMIKTGEFGWWGAGTNIQAHGEGVRIAGVAAIVMGFFCLFPGVLLWGARIFKGSK